MIITEKNVCGGVFRFRHDAEVAARELGERFTIVPLFAEHYHSNDTSAERVAKAEEQRHKPVAWMYDWYAEDEDIDGVPTGGIVNDWISKDYDESHSPTMGCHNIRPLYLAPPQREWKTITSAQRKVMWNMTKKPSEYGLMVEEKLKELNGF